MRVLCQAPCGVDHTPRTYIIVRIYDDGLCKILETDDVTEAVRPLISEHPGYQCYVYCQIGRAEDP